MNVRRVARQLERERVGAALDVARELVGDDRDDGHDERQRQRHGGHGARAERGAARRERSASTATAHMPNGATIASQISPLRTSWWCTWPSSCATTRRVSAGVKSFTSVS